MLGSVVLEQIGAGILGFSMTFALTNVWSHGTWVTPGHAHLALFGTFGMLGIAAAYYAVPIMRKAPDYDQRLGKLGFWLVLTGVLGLAFAFVLGGTVQIYVYRILGLGWFGGDVSRAMGLFKLLLPMFGIVFTVGAGILAYDLFTLGRRVRAPAGTDPRGAIHGEVAMPRGSTGWGRPLSGFEAGIWLMLMWVFGGVITLGLLSFNLPRVRVLADPTLPYLLAGVGYPGLLLVTLAFVWRFLASLEARASLPAPTVVAVDAPLPLPARS